MNFYENPKRSEWRNILARPKRKAADLQQICSAVFNEVESMGDAALIKYTEQFDKVLLSSIAVSEAEFNEAEKLMSVELKSAIELAYRNIFNFHNVQKTQGSGCENGEGIRCWQEFRAIERVGLYIPGGSAPLFSTVLMLAVPAKIAGCSEIVLCTPPSKDGKVNPAILWTARYCGVTKVFKVGGVQAIAALALGTESIPSVYKIFGPGNQFVMAAKQMAQSYGAAIDMPAGPSEVMVVADNSADVRFVAADLLSQAEHGPDSQVVIVTTSPNIAKSIGSEVERQVALLPRAAIAEKALENSRIVLFSDMSTVMDFANEYAPEHLILSVANYNDYIPQVKSAGSVFLGNYAPESAGDYASGTNHTLPTSGYAKAYSGVCLDSYMKRISFQEITKEGLATIGTAVRVMAENEQLQAHANAVKIRLTSMK